MKTVTSILVKIVIATSIFSSGCDCVGSKPGGGGHPQPYDCGNGRYKIALVGSVLAILLCAKRSGVTC